jgi:hypothetical protein
MAMEEKSSLSHTIQTFTSIPEIESEQMEMKE